MATSSLKLKRYFKNPYLDYIKGETVINIDKSYWSDYLQEYVLLCVKKTKLNHDTCDGGLYVGSLGLVYMLYKVLSGGYCKEHSKNLEKYLHELIDVNSNYALRNKDKNDVTSFLLGNCGFYVMGSLFSKYIQNDNESCLKFARYYHETSKICEIEGFLSQGCDELFVGRAGILCGALFYRKKLGIDVLPEDQLFRIIDKMIKSGREYAKSHNSPCPLMYSYYKTQYLGAAHGLASILQMILCFPNYLKSHQDVENDVKKCIDFFISIQTREGNFPSAMDELKHGGSRGSEDELIHWCHGAPGVVWCIARAYLYWNEQSYLESCKRCSDLVWSKGLLRKGPSICHGVAGNGYVHLLLYRLTNDEKYLYRALKFAEFLETKEFKSEARQPDNPLSLYEGLAGTVCFLIDLINPNEAEFPFFDIFN